MESEFFAHKSSRNEKRILAYLAFIGLIGALCAITYSYSSSSSPLLSDYQLQVVEFNQYLEKFEKSYTEEEHTARFQIYRDNLAYIRLQNSLNKS